MTTGHPSALQKHQQENIYLFLPLNWNLIAKAQDDQTNTFPFPQTETAFPLHNIYLTVVPLL